MWFLSARKAQRPLSSRRRTSPYRPRLEALEDRCLLNAGSLDPTLGNGAGYVTTALSSTSDSVQQVLVQPSGNIVAAGQTSIPVTTTTTNHKTTTTNVNVFGAVTYNPDGSLDTAFGSGGIVKQPFAGQGTHGAHLWGAALEPMGAAGDGKIVLAGQDTAQGGLALMRLNANGSLDTSFGGSGQVITQFQTSGNVGFEEAQAVTVTSTGQIVALGSDQSYSWLLARYNPDGSLDSTFGSSGKATLVFSSSATGFSTYVTSVAQQPDGKLVVAGRERWSNYPASGQTNKGIVVRFNANGSLDTSFGSGGVATTVVGSLTQLQNRGIAIYPNAGTANDGKIVGSSLVYTTPGSTSTSQAAVERYNPDGSPDTTFGNGTGSVLIANPSTYTNGLAQAVAIESDGKPIFVGDLFSGQTNPPPDVLEVGRLNLDGSLDSSFGNGGLVTTAMLGNAGGGPVALQPDGKIVAAGASWVNGGNNEFAVARYLPSEPEIGSFTASANPVTAGSNETFTVSGITDGNANSTITQVAFYYFDSTGTKQVLGYGTQTSPGVWTLNYTVSLASGTYTIYAQAEDSYGVFGDPFALSLTVQ
jgi:uncharacterized delta-60 repeat protein